MPDTLTLQDMVDAVLAQAGPGGMAKIAQEANGSRCDECGKPAMADSKLCRACAEKMSNREEDRREGEDSTGAEKTSSARIQKLASAVAYIVENFGSIDRPIGRVKMAQVPTQASDMVGAGKGPNVIPTNLDSPVTGEQATVKGEATVGTVPKNPPLGSGATPKAPQNAMDDNIDAMKPDYPEEGVMKQARARLREVMMYKMAETGVDDGAAQIGAPKTQTVTYPEEQPSQMKRPAEVTSQESMINSSEAAIDYQKTQAKSVPKMRMGEVLQENPQDVKQVLQPVLGDVVKQANQQRAAVGRALLAKIAHEGCKCANPETGECRFCKVAARLKRSRGMRKKSMNGAGAGMGGNPIGPGGVPPTVQSSSPIGGGSMGSGTPPM